MPNQTLEQAQERMRVAEMEQLREAVAAYTRGENIGVFTTIVAPLAPFFRGQGAG